MNIKFVVVGLLVIAGLFFGTEKYWEHKFQQQARDNLKQVHMDAQTQQRLGCGLLAEGIMNHLTVQETVKVTQRFPDQNENEKNTGGEEKQVCEDNR